MSSERWNILWVVWDTVRPDHLSCYGYERKTTPFLEDLARESVLYERAISPSAWTLPSHASMLTGLFPGRHRADDHSRWLDVSAVTLPQALCHEGYHTALFSNNPFVSSLTNLHQGFETFCYIPHAEPADKTSLFPPGRDCKEPVHSRDGIDLGAHQTNKRVKEHLLILQERCPHTPFFIFINYMEAHAPYGKTIFGAHYLGESKSNRAEAEAVTGHVFENRFEYALGIKQLDSKTAQTISDLYDGDLLYLDAQLKDLVFFLKEQELFDHTMLIVTSDHGEHLGEHNRLGHGGHLCHVLAHIPLLIRCPQQDFFPPGTRVSRYVQTTDLFPTLLDLLSIRTVNRKKLQGFPLGDTHRPPMAMAEASFSKTVPPEERQKILERYGPSGMEEFLGTYRSLYYEDYNYTWKFPNKEYLWNITDDSYQENNLVKTYPDLAQELRNRLKSFSRNVHASS